MTGKDHRLNRRSFVVGLGATTVASGGAFGCDVVGAVPDLATFTAIPWRATGGADEIVTAGWSLHGIGAARYRRVAAPTPAIVRWASRAAATSRDGYHYVLVPGETIEVDQFGAVGDDDSDDFDAIQAAIAFWQMVGGTLAFTAGRRYFVGRWSSTDNRVFMIDHLRAATIDGRGATLRTHSSATRCQTYLFTLRDFRDVTIRRLHATDSGTDINVEWRGLYFVSPDANLGPCANLVLHDVTVTNAVALVFVAGSLPARVSGIRITNCLARHCYYGMCFAENGDDVYAELETDNCRRSYFAYGVHGHKIRLIVNHDGGGAGADACCLIKRYVFDTAQIELAATFHGSVAGFANLVKLEHQPMPVGTIGSISEISIALDLQAVTTGLDRVTGIGFASYAGARLETVPTANRWQNIKISGDLSRLRQPFAGYSSPARGVAIDADGLTLGVTGPLPTGYTLRQHSPA